MTHNQKAMEGLSSGSLLGAAADYCLSAQFTVTDELGTSDELDIRHELEKNVAKRFSYENTICGHKVGVVDGGQSGAGTMEIFCYVTDLKRAVHIVREELDKLGLITSTIAYHKDANFWVRFSQEGWQTISSQEWKAWRLVK